MTWDLIWINSMGNHGVGGGGYSQNEGILVVLVLYQYHKANMVLGFFSQSIDDPTIEI